MRKFKKSGFLKNRSINIISRFFLSAFFVISFFYTTPVFINFANKNFSNKDEKKNVYKHQKIKKTIREYQKFIKNNFDYVGENFAYEARSIHYNNKKKNKGIYGTASKQDLKELKEEGIDAQMVPWFENEKN